MQTPRMIAHTHDDDRAILVTITPLQKRSRLFLRPTRAGNPFYVHDPQRFQLADRS